MATISRYEFTGSWIFFWFLCITGVGIPVAILYLLNGTIRIEEHNHGAGDPMFLRHSAAFSGLSQS